MNWRIIIRTSLTRDAGSQLRNNVIKPLLEECGIRRTRTGLWESEASEPQCAAETLSKLLNEFANLASIDEPDSPMLNHLWIYIDQSNDETSEEIETE